MGDKYILQYDENGNVIDPAFWDDSLSVFAGEFNGGLDRDNFPQATIVSGDCSSPNERIFNDVSQSLNTTTSFAPDMQNTGRQGGAGNNASGILQRTFISTQDAHWDLHWSGEWSWNGAYSWVQDGTRPDTTDTFDTVKLYMSVDGVTIAEAGPFEDGCEYWSTYMVASIQLPAGSHTFTVECECVRRIVQDGQLDGKCTNSVTFNERNFLPLQRSR